MARWEVHLALWDALVIEGGHSMDIHKEQGDRCRKRMKKKPNKNKRKAHASTGAAAGTRGWYILDMRPPFLDKAVKDKSVKAKESMCECVF